jgi:hypothetical protein
MRVLSLMSFFKHSSAWDVVAASDGHECLHAEIHLVQAKAKAPLSGWSRKPKQTLTGVWETSLLAGGKTISVFMAGHSNYSRFAQDWFPRRKAGGTGAPMLTLSPAVCYVAIAHSTVFCTLS